LLQACAPDTGSASALLGARVVRSMPTIGRR
jgi:hypothetical protein